MEETATRPKPMVEIGGYPLLWHIMSVYAAQGFKDFLVALGYRQDAVRQYFLDLNQANQDMTVDLSTGEVRKEAERRLDWNVGLIDTGWYTQTGGRVKRLAERLRGSGTFMMTYGDGVADVDLKKLLAFHESHGKLATLTAVHAPDTYGRMRLDGVQVAEFHEKPEDGAGWINGGFFVLSERVLDYIDGDDTVWEREPVERLAASGELMAYRHEGFWAGLNNNWDRTVLENLWVSRRAPWKIW
jgi:glucose-1-phosphate cytidylyltransferase